MTSTPFNVGLNETARVSSRVLRPPGGGHTDIFGSEPEPPQRTGRRIVPNAGQGDMPKPTNGTDAPTANGQSTPAEAPQVAEVKQDNSSKPSSAKVEQEPAKMEAPKRVRVPPGGFSSGLW